MKTVRTITLLLFGFAFCLLMACSKKEKEAPDTREQFLGAWKGKMNAKLPLLDTAKNVTMTVSKTANSSNKLNFTADQGLTFTATADGNNFTIDERTAKINYLGNDFPLALNGSGTVNGKTMTGSGTATYLTYSGPWSMNLTKQ